MLKDEEITLYAKQRVTIGWGGGQSAHIDDPRAWKHAAIFEDDGITVINDGTKGTAPATPGTPGTGGGGSTPPTAATAGSKKYCIYLSDSDNTGNSSELSLLDTFAALHGPQVKLGTGGTAHSPQNYILLAQTAIDFVGSYANPDNQFHIYARFG